MGVTAGIIVPPAISVDVLGWEFSMHVKEGQARDWRLSGRAQGLRAGQRKGERRRQHAKQIDQGDKPPRSRTLRSGHSDEQAGVNTFWSQTHEHNREP
jgi:hypothetical protein